MNRHSNYKRSLKDKIINEYGGEPRSLDELGNTVVKILNDESKGLLIGFKWDIRHRDVANTHNCPIDGVQNWNQRQTNGIPTSYKGWAGRVWIRLSDELQKLKFASDLFSKTLTYTGTGGGGCYNGPWSKIYGHWASTERNSRFKKPILYSWDYRFYDDDWPEVTASLMKRKSFNALASSYEDLDKHIYFWENPAARIRDENMIDSIVCGKLSGVERM